MTSPMNVDLEAIRFHNETYVLQRIAWVTRLIASWWPGTETCLEQYLETKELLKDAKRGGCSVACVNGVAQAKLRLARRLGIAVNATEHDLVKGDLDLQAETKEARISDDEVFTWQQIAACPDPMFEAFIQKKKAHNKLIRAADLIKADKTNGIFDHEDADRLKQYEAAFNFTNPERYVMTEDNRGEFVCEMLHEQSQISRLVNSATEGSNVYDETSEDDSSEDGPIDFMESARKCGEEVERWVEWKRQQLLGPLRNRPIDSVMNARKGEAAQT